MQIRSLIPVLAAVLLGACASGGASDPTFKTLAIDDAGAVRTTTMPAARRSVDGSLDKVFTALPAAYAVIGVNIDVSDPGTHRVGSASFAVHGHMNGEPVSHFANCGNGMTGPIADTRRVVFSAITTATAVDAAHTALVTDVQAYAVDVSGGSTDRVACGSTGALEQLLYKALEQRLSSN